MTQSRKYSSPLRKQQAILTRESILDAAKHVLAQKGYTKATIEAIANVAGVASQTIYHIFKNKTNLFTELLEQHITTLVEQKLTLLPETLDIHEFFHQCIEIAIHVNSQKGNIALLGINILSPEFAKIQKALEQKARIKQREHLESILKKYPLKSCLTLDKALDIFWCMTNCHNYRMMVLDCGWSLEEYKQWLYNSLIMLILGEKS